MKKISTQRGPSQTHVRQMFYTDDIPTGNRLLFIVYYFHIQLTHLSLPIGSQQFMEDEQDHHILVNLSRVKLALRCILNKFLEPFCQVRWVYNCWNYDNTLS